MATFGGWTEMREYRVWQAEDIYSVVSVDQHRNGHVRLYVDSEIEWSGISLTYAYDMAYTHAVALMNEAQATCLCGQSAEECGWVYDTPHGVRLQVTDVQENRSLDPSEF